MTASEEDILRDQSERSGLQKAIADVETVLSVSRPGTRRILENSLDGMKGRVATLDKKIGDAIHERDVQAREQAATIAAQAQKEARLSESEKQTYSGFLAKEFFTKRDFGKLELFYAHTYDRLSEGGKDEMSHRVWEGVRHGEYRFTDLPEDVQKKEAKRAYDRFIDPTRKRDDLEQVPETDRNDFIRAYKSGDRKELGEVVNRESFCRNMAIDASKGVNHQTATAGKTADDYSILAEDKTRNISPDNSSAMAKIKSASEKLKDLTLDDSPPTPLAANIPNAAASQVNERSPA